MKRKEEIEHQPVIPADSGFDLKDPAKREGIGDR